MGHHPCFNPLTPACGWSLSLSDHRSHNRSWIMFLVQLRECCCSQVWCNLSFQWR